MKLYEAIDLHSADKVTVVINEHDQVVYQKRLLNDLSLIARPLSSYRASLEGIVVVPIFFGGKESCRGEENSIDFPMALNLMGDWCGPPSDTD